MEPINYPLKCLNLLDVKFENLQLNYKNFGKVTISSIQASVESVAVLNNGTSLEVISSDKDLGNDYEISFSVSNILFDIDGDTSLRIPLINIIIISNVLLCVSEDIPLNKTTISCTINVINPSLFSTINQLFSLIEKYEALHLSLIHI